MPQKAQKAHNEKELREQEGPLKQTLCAFCAFLWLRKI
jgi:hypothetical protein